MGEEACHVISDTTQMEGAMGGWGRRGSVDHLPLLDPKELIQNANASQKSLMWCRCKHIWEYFKTFPPNLIKIVSLNISLC